MWSKSGHRDGLGRKYFNPAPAHTGAGRCDALKQPAFGETGHPAARHDQMVNYSNINELQRVAQSLSDQLVCCAGFCNTRGVIVHLMCLAAFCALNFESR